MLKTITQARAALSMLNPNEVRRLAGRPVHFGLVAGSEAGYRVMEDFLLAGDAPPLQVHRADSRDVPEKVDLVVYEPGVADPEGGYAFDLDGGGQFVDSVVRGQEDLAIPLAAQFPAFRKRVVERTIHEVARENAFFAVATAMPNVVPNFIQLPWAVGEFASDTAFLTANQVRMAFLIAAASGREPGISRQFGPVATIAGGAFGWRAIARELVGKIPLGGGLIPKGAIAYAGTYVVGKALERYYQNGKLSRAARELAYREAYERGKDVAREFRRQPS
jgi:uncharacterized protein (DUF697 family)